MCELGGYRLVMMTMVWKQRCLYVYTELHKEKPARKNIARQNPTHPPRPLPFMLFYYPRHHNIHG